VKEVFMVIRNKCGEYRVDNCGALLGFLGVKMDAAGVQAVGADVELIASAPFALAAGGEAAIPGGIAWTLSTFDLDRFDERIDPAGWDFKRYLDNPVVEWAHRYDIPAIGRADSLYADDKGLHGVVVFNDKEYDPFGWGIGQRVKAGVIRAGSVGFRVLEIEIPDKETGKDGTALICRKQELLDFSICNVPANPWALAKPLALMKSEVEPSVRKPSVRLGMRSEEIKPNFWGTIINNFGEV
jgi:HK97 family phage prohead protease